MQRVFLVDYRNYGLPLIYVYVLETCCLSTLSIKYRDIAVESVDGIVPCNLRHKKKSTPLKVFKMSWVETLKTLPQQLASHKKGDVTHETRK